MLRATKAFIGKYPIQNQLILSKTIQVNEELSVSCGFDVSLKFKPALVITQTVSAERKEEIKFDMTEWLALSGLKNYIHIQLSTNHTEAKDESFTIMNIESAIFCLKYDNVFSTTLVIRQLGWEIELNADEWTKLMDFKYLMDGFFLWSEYARGAIYGFYSTKYIPKCISLNVLFLAADHYHTVIPTEKKLFYIRLCKEFENMKWKVAKDINKALHTN